MMYGELKLESLAKRFSEIKKEINETSLYTHTSKEIEYGARVACVILTVVSVDYTGKVLSLEMRDISIMKRISLNRLRRILMMRQMVVKLCRSEERRVGKECRGGRAAGG